ncbi:TolC family protein [Myxococcota bacterium]|nr:TolC family protein [Myxococcota bacterium]
MGPARAAELLTLKDFLGGVMQKNPGVQRILIQEELAKAQLQSAQAVDDLTLLSSGTLGRSEFDGMTAFEPDSSIDAALGLALEQTFSATGTRLAFGLESRLTDRDPAHTILGTRYYQPSLTLRLTQPLMKNFGGVQDVLPQALGQHEVQLAQLRIQEELESYLSRMVALYLDWFLAYREMQVSEEVYEQIQGQEKHIRLKVSRQIAERYELYRVQEAREDYYARYQQAKGRYEGLSLKLRQQMKEGFPQDATPLDPGSSPLFRVIKSEPEFFVTSSRLKQILDVLEAQQALLIEARANALKPSLDLSLAYRRHTADEAFLDAHTRDFNSNDIFLTLAYRFPLGNQGARGAYAFELARRRLLHEDMAQQMTDAQAALDDLVVQVDHLKIALEASEKKNELATKKLKEENRLYNIGRLDLFELIQDQSALLESRLVREQRYVNILRMKLSIGELLDQNLQHFQKKAEKKAEEAKK